MFKFVFIYLQSLAINFDIFLSNFVFDFILQILLSFYVFYFIDISFFVLDRIFLFTFKCVSIYLAIKFYISNICIMDYFDLSAYLCPFKWQYNLIFYVFLSHFMSFYHRFFCLPTYLCPSICKGWQ